MESSKHLARDLSLVALLWCGLVIFFAVHPLAPVRRHLGLALSYALLSMAPALVLASIERFCTPAGPRKSRRQWLLHLQINISYHLVLGIATVFLIALTAVVFKRAGLNLGWIELHLVSKYGILGILVAFLLGNILYEFFFYWMHRWMHEVPVLWQHHKLHHMDEQFDAMTAARQNWVEALFHVLMISIPLAIFFKLDSLDPFGLGLAGGIAIALLNGIRNINHSNLRLQFGRASVLFISSQYHRIHHSRLPQHRDKNFSSAFPIWDIVFRTYYAPAHDEFPPTGVDGEEDIRSYWEAQLFTLRQWRRTYQSWRHRPTAALN